MTSQNASFAPIATAPNLHGVGGGLGGMDPEVGRVKTLILKSTVETSRHYGQPVPSVATEVGATVST